MRMVDIGAGGAGAYPPPLNGNTTPMVVVGVAVVVHPKPRFHVAAVLLDPVPMKSISSFALLPLLANY